MSNPVVLVYSHRAEVRERDHDRRSAGGPRRMSAGSTSWSASGVADVLAAVDDRTADVLILDAEAQPTGGMGISRQIHLEAEHMPPIILTCDGWRTDGWPPGPGPTRSWCTRWTR